jgi:hypothetical protein
MGNAATVLGDNLTCFREHENAAAVSSGTTSNTGRDLDDAVLAAVNQSINANQTGLVNTVTLSFACQDLPNMDTFTRTDGMAVLYRQAGSGWAQIGMTEVIMDNLAPVWIKSFDVQYHFEQRENYKVEVYDIDNFDRLQDFGSHDYIGSVQFALHEVVTAREQTLERLISNDARAEGKSGLLKVTAEEKTLKSSEEVFMRCSASFPSMTGMYFFLIHKQISATIWKPVYKSEIR